MRHAPWLDVLLRGRGLRSICLAGDLCRRGQAPPSTSRRQSRVCPAGGPWILACSPRCGCPRRRSPPHPWLHPWGVAQSCRRLTPPCPPARAGVTTNKPDRWPGAASEFGIRSTLNRDPKWHLCYIYIFYLAGTLYVVEGVLLFFFSHIQTSRDQFVVGPRYFQEPRQRCAVSCILIGRLCIDWSFREAYCFHCDFVGMPGRFILAK